MRIQEAHPAAWERIARAAGGALASIDGRSAIRPCSIEGARRAVAAAIEEGLRIGADVELDRSDLRQIGLVDRHAMWIPAGAGAIVADVEAALRRVGLTLGAQPPAVLAGTVGAWLEGPFAGRRAMDGRLESGVAAVQAVLRDGTPWDGRAAPRTAAGPGVAHLLLGGGARCGWILAATLKAQRLPPTTSWVAFSGPPDALARLLRGALHGVHAPLEARLLGPRRLELRLASDREDERAAIHRLRRTAAAAGLAIELPRVPPCEGAAEEIATSALVARIEGLGSEEPLGLVRLAQESCVAVGRRVGAAPASHAALLARIAAHLEPR